MRQKSVPEKEPATQVVKNIRRATRRHFSAEDRIRIVLEGLRGEDSIAELCRREGIVQNLYCRWSKDFAGKKRLAGDTARARSSYSQQKGPCLQFKPNAVIQRAACSAEFCRWGCAAAEQRARIGAEA